MNGGPGGSCRISPYPEPVVVPACADSGTDVPGCNIDGDDLRGGAFHEQDVVRAHRFIDRIGQIHVPSFDRKVATEGFEAGVTEVGVLDPGQAAAWKEPDGRAAGAGGAGKAVRRPAEIVDESIIPVTQEFADHADPRATRVEAVIQILWRGRRGIGPVIVAADIEMQPAGDRNAILIVRRAD